MYAMTFTAQPLRYTSCNINIECLVAPFAIIDKTLMIGLIEIVEIALALRIRSRDCNGSYTYRFLMR